MPFGLEKSLILWLRRVLAQAAAAEQDKLNRQIVHEFDIPGSQQFDPSYFPGFFNDMNYQSGGG